MVPSGHFSLYGRGGAGKMDVGLRVDVNVKVSVGLRVDVGVSVRGRV
jgi:hypothetical protein